MLKVRVIPVMLLKGVGLVKGVGFDSWRRIGPVLPAIKVYNSRDVDELVLLDLNASKDGESPDVEALHDFADECFVPFTVGGGITDIETVRRLLRAGADKVTINSAAYERPKLIEECARKFGSQCVVASIDARADAAGGYDCFSHCGSRPTGKKLTDWARELVDRGAGELLVTSIERDGTMAGYDLRMVESVTSAIRVPVIAAGGAGTFEHMRQAIQEAGASAVAAASIFHFTDKTPKEARQYLADAGIDVRKSYLT